MSSAPQKNTRGGQILVLMSLLSTTLIILFGMVVGIGHLVQAKINLQNAVDLAAMSGASWQARYLNQISLVNYRMRQNYKFMLYDLYLTQSRFNQSFKSKVVASSGPFDRLSSGTVAFGICQQVRGYCGVAAIGENASCVSATTDLCQNVGDIMRTIPPITPSPVVTDNPVLIAINASIIQLSLTAQQFCTDSAGQNKAYFSYIMKSFDERQRFQVEQIVQVLNDFNGVFTADPEGDVLASSSVGDAVIKKTFVDNLIAANQSSDMQLVHLNDPKARSFQDPNISRLPQTIFNKNSPGGTFDQYFDRQRVSFKILYVDFISDPATGCRPEIVKATYPGANGGGSFIGLSRSRLSPSAGPVKIPFHIALRATVKPNLLFWPTGFTPTLVAVAVAKPFGSRIGPSAEQTSIETRGTRDPDDAAQANMSFYPGDDALHVGGNFLPGVGHTHILKQLLTKLPNPDSGTNSDRPSPNLGVNCDVANPPFMCLALAPTLYEGFFWNVFPYSSRLDTAFATVFGAFGSALRQVFPERSPGGLGVDVTDAKYDMPDRGASGSTPSWHATTYIGDLGPFKVSGKPAFFANAESALSSWSPSLKPDKFEVNDIRSSGRLGYQIKLVSFPQICNEIEAGGSTISTGNLDRYCDPQKGVFH